MPEIAEPFLRAGKVVIVLSAGALLVNEHLIALARQCGGQIVVPTGALLGLDAVTAAAEGEIRSVRMVTRKPVRGLAGAPYLAEHNIRIEDITEPVRIFSGTPREAAIGFPANLNVAVALSLAGIGADRTTLDIWADPSLERNVHRIEVDAEFRVVLDVDRKYPVGQSEDRPDHGAVGDLLFAKARRAAARRLLRTQMAGIKSRPSRIRIDGRLFGLVDIPEHRRRRAVETPVSDFRQALGWVYSPSGM